MQRGGAASRGQAAGTGGSIGFPARNAGGDRAGADAVGTSAPDEGVRGSAFDGIGLAAEDGGEGRIRAHELAGTAGDDGVGAVRLNDILRAAAEGAVAAPNHVARTTGQRAPLARDGVALAEEPGQGGEFRTRAQRRSEIRAGGVDGLRSYERVCGQSGRGRRQRERSQQRVRGERGRVRLGRDEGVQGVRHGRERLARFQDDEICRAIRRPHGDLEPAR
jgi:hypothetical protein